MESSVSVLRRSFVVTAPAEQPTPMPITDEERSALSEAGAEAAIRLDWEREQFQRAAAEFFEEA